MGTETLGPQRFVEVVNTVKASDVYAMGCIMAKVVSLQREACLAKQGIKTTSTPKFIVHVMRSCLRPNDSQHPSAGEASGEFGDHILEEKFEMEDADPAKIFEVEAEIEEHNFNEAWREIPD